MKALNRTQLKQASYARNEFHVTTGAGSTIDELLNPLVWAHVANQMKKFDLVEVVCEDGSYYAELLVTKAKGPEIALAILRHVNLAETDTSSADLGDYEVKFRGKAKWSIVRKNDKVVIKDGFDSKDAAAAELEKVAA